MKWQTFLKEYRAKHPTISYKVALSRASKEYKSKCSSDSVITNKLKKATRKQKDQVCDILNLDTNRQPNAKKSVRHTGFDNVVEFKKPSQDYYDNPYWNEDMQDAYFEMSDDELDRQTQKDIKGEQRQQKNLKKWIKKDRLSNNPFAVLSTLGNGRVTGSGMMLGNDHRTYSPDWYLHPKVMRY